MTFKRLPNLAIVALAAAFPALASGSTWEIDPVHSSVRFAIGHLMVSSVHGEFRSFAGTATVPSDDPTKASITGKIEAKSIDTGNADRDAHLRSAQFLDVEKFPTIEFQSKRVESQGDGRYRVAGDLTLHGVTREVVLDVEGATRAVTNPLDGSTRTGATAKTTLDRKDFGLTWNKTLDSGGVMIGDEVTVEIAVELVRKGTNAPTAP